MNCFTLYAKNLAVSGTTLTITVSGINFATLSNLTRFNLVICTSIPQDAGTSQVVLSDGTTTVNVFNVSGNYLRADQITCRKRYPLVYGNDPQHVSVQRLLCNTSYQATSTSSTSTQEQTSTLSSTSKSKG